MEDKLKQFLQNKTSLNNFLLEFNKQLKTKEKFYILKVDSNKRRVEYFATLEKELNKIPEIKSVVYDKNRKTLSSVGGLVIEFKNDEIYFIIMKEDKSLKLAKEDTPKGKQLLFADPWSPEEYVIFCFMLIFGSGRPPKTIWDLQKIYPNGIEKHLNQFSNAKEIIKKMTVSPKEFFDNIINKEITPEEERNFEHYFLQADVIYAKFGEYFDNPKDLFWGTPLNKIKNDSVKALGFNSGVDKWNPSDLFIATPSSLTLFNLYKSGKNSLQKLEINNAFASPNTLEHDKIIGVSLKKGSLDKQGNLKQISVNGKIVSKKIKYNSFPKEINPIEISNDVIDSAKKMDSLGGKWKLNQEFFYNKKEIIDYVKKNQNDISSLSGLFDFINASYSWEDVLLNKGEKLKDSLADAFSLTSKSCPYWKSIHTQLLFMDKEYLKDVKFGDFEINYALSPTGKIITPKNSKINFTVETNHAKINYAFIFRDFSGGKFPAKSFEIGTGAYELKNINNFSFMKFIENNFYSEINKFLNLNEEDVIRGKNPAIVILGRFQPFTNGHLFLLKEAKKIDPGSKIIVCVVKGEKSSQDKQKNPFPFDLQKEMIIKGSNGLVSDVIEIKNAFIGDWLPELRSHGYEPLYWMVGSDRANSYEMMLDKIREKLNTNIEIVPNKRISVEGQQEDISATSARQAIKNDDETKLKTLVPDAVFKMKEKLKKYIEKRLLELSHIYDISKKGKEFVDNLLNKNITVMQKLDGSFFSFTKKTNRGLQNPFFLIYYGRNGKPIDVTKRASMMLYEPIIEHLEKLFKETNYFSFISSETTVIGEYFPNGLKPLVPIKTYPKNSWVLFDVKENGTSLDLEKVEEIANKLEVDGPPIIFKGKLNSNQKQALTEFIFSDDNTRKIKFKDISFSQFILQLLNPKFKLKINDEILEGVVFTFEGEQPISLKMVDPLFTVGIINKKTDAKEDKELQAYRQTIKEIMLNFMEKHLNDIKKLAVKYSKKEDVELSFIELINAIFEEFSSELKSYANLVGKYKEIAKSNDLGDLFRLNPKFVSQEIISMANKYFFIEDMYKLIIGHFLNPKRRAAGLFNQNEIERLNTIINAIEYVLTQRG